MNLSDNTILITGGGSGIGLALAKQFLQLDNRVIICGRDIEKLNSARKIFPSLEIIQCDISDESSVNELGKVIQQKYSGLDFLINNAGIMRTWNIQNKIINIKEYKEELFTNVFGTIQLTQSLIPQLTKQNESAILNVSSALAYAPISSMPVYCASKAALHSYTISLREQLNDTSIQVFELLPAGIDTEMSREVEKRLGLEGGMPKMSPDKLATLTIKGLKRDTHEIRPGMAGILYAMNRFFPAQVNRMMAKESKKILTKLR